MGPVLVDTDVISMIFKSHTKAAPYQELLRERPLLVSFMSIGELYLWAQRRNWGRARIERLERQLDDYAFLPSTWDICQRWARVTDEAMVKGRPMSVQDAWNAAVALHYRVALVTNNVSDYEVLEELEILSA